MKKFVYVVAGFLAGILVIGTTTAFTKMTALIGKAYWNKDVTILFDGKTRILTDDYVVMNYLDYNYTSARFIAEGLGAKVDYDEKTETIKVTSPVRDEVIYEELNVKEAYSEVPFRYEDDRVKMVVNGFQFEGYPTIYYTIDKVTDRPVFDYENAYMEYEGEKYLARYGNRIDWIQNLSTAGETKLVFEDVERAGSDEVKVVIPYYDSRSEEDEYIELLLKLPRVEAIKE